MIAAERDIRHRRKLLFAAIAATLLVSLPPLYEFFRAKDPSDWLVRTLVTMILFPGYIVAALISWVVLPEGSHGMETFTFLGMPLTWLFYFSLLAWFQIRFQSDAVGTRKVLGTVSARPRQIVTRQIWFGLLSGCVVGGIGLFIAFERAGGGHGSYVAAKLLFPYSMLLAMKVSGRITATLLAMALAQFPLYGFLIGAASRRNLRGRSVIAILLLHTITVGICFLIEDATFATVF